MGKELVFRQRAGQTVISLPPVARPDKPTLAQQAMRQRFRQAVRYARMVIANPALKEVYLDSIRYGANAYNTAITDCLTAPVITRIDLSNDGVSSGNIIRIWADDDFKVISVKVALFSAAGDLLEEGPAVADAENCWRYTVIADAVTLAGGRVSAEVSDLPGNVGRKEIVV